MANPSEEIKPKIPRMTSEGPGRYRIGDYTITHERPRMWRVTWDPKQERYRSHSGVIMEAFLSLRSARIHVEEEIEAEQTAARP